MFYPTLTQMAEKSECLQTYSKLMVASCQVLMLASVLHECRKGKGIGHGSVQQKFEIRQKLFGFRLPVVEHVAVVSCLLSVK